MWKKFVTTFIRGRLRLRRTHSPKRIRVCHCHRSKVSDLKKLVGQFETPELKLIGENKQFCQCKFKWEEKQHKVLINNGESWSKLKLLFLCWVGMKELKQPTFLHYFDFTFRLRWKETSFKTISLFGFILFPVTTENDHKNSKRWKKSPPDLEDES